MHCMDPKSKKLTEGLVPWQSHSKTTRKDRSDARLDLWYCMILVSIFAYIYIYVYINIYTYVCVCVNLFTPGQRQTVNRRVELTFRASSPTHPCLAEVTSFYSYWFKNLSAPPELWKPYMDELVRQCLQQRCHLNWVDVLWQVFHWYTYMDHGFLARQAWKYHAPEKTWYIHST